MSIKQKLFLKVFEYYCFPRSTHFGTVFGTKQIVLITLLFVLYHHPQPRSYLRYDSQLACLVGLTSHQ